MRPSMIIDCPICSQSPSRELVSKGFSNKERLVRCEGCGLVRLFGETTSQSDYWQYDEVALDVYDNHEVRAQLRERHKYYLRLMARLCGRTGSLLDAGCGIGNFLVTAREEGWEVAGVEVSEKASKIARGKGLDIETSRLEDSQWPPGVFDAVTLWDIIEHLEEPCSAMSVVHEKLRAGGMVFLETPDEGFWLRPALRGAFTLSRGCIDLLGYFYYGDHRFYFTATTLSRILSKAGFQNVQVWRDVTLPAKARLKIAPWGFPLDRLALRILPSFLGLMGWLGIGNKLMVTATKV